MKKLLMTTVAALAVAAATSANAATFGAKPLDCKGNTGCFLLTIEGDLKLGDDEEFKKLIAKNNVKLAVVGLHSNGGNVLAAYGIGNVIRDSGFTTFVPSWGYCISACGMIWMSGATRQAEEKAHIGFHGAYLADNKGRVIGGASAGNALMGSFYARLGLSDMAVVYLTSAGPKDMRWLSGADAKKYSIAVHTINTQKGDAFVVGPWPKEAQAVLTSPGISSSNRLLKMQLKWH